MNPGSAKKILRTNGTRDASAAADALLVVPPDALEVAAGTVLRAIPLEGDLGGSDRFLP